MTEIMNYDCGVDMDNETAASDYFNKIETCSFWMEGVLLTATGKQVVTNHYIHKVMFGKNVFFS